MQKFINLSKSELYAHWDKYRTAVLGIALEAHPNFDVDVAVSSQRIVLCKSISYLKRWLK